MRFIKIELVGGLGNQLFQYAMARAQMRKLDTLLFDVSSYKNDHYGRHFTLNKYSVIGKTLEHSNWERFFNPNSKVSRLIRKAGMFSIINESGFHVHTNIKSRLRTFTSLNGYWQSDKYFSAIRQQLQREIVPKTLPQLPAFLQQKETVVVHIRRTDFLNDSRFGFLGKDYYTNAISQIKAQVSDPFFVFFSDDIAWCRQNFQESNSSYCEYPHDYIRLYLMAQCKHHIISNSSFSWWGAWLCNNPQQMVMRPARPFKDESLLYEDYYPEKWISVLN